MATVSPSSTLFSTRISSPPAAMDRATLSPLSLHNTNSTLVSHAIFHRNGCPPSVHTSKSCSSLSFAASEGLFTCKILVLSKLSNRRTNRRRFIHGVPPCQAALGEYTTATAVVYGTALFGGGLFAYLRTASKGSLSGGLTGGALLGITYFLLQNPDTERLGEALGFGGSLLFAALFAIRLFATKKPVPSGPLLVLSSVASIVFASAYFS